MLLNLLTIHHIRTVQGVQRENGISQQVDEVLREKLCMVEHAEELMKVGSEHDEVKWALEPIFDQGPLELVDVWEDKLLIVLVKFDERLSDERDVMPLILLSTGDLGRHFTLNVSLGSCFNLLGKLMDLHFLTLADLNNLDRRVFD